MPVLINLAPPRPLESLSSYVVRLCRLNHYRQPEAIHDLLPYFRRPFNSLRELGDYQILSELTRQSPATLYGLTLHRFVGAYQQPEQVAAGPWLPLDPPLPLWVAQQIPVYGQVRHPVAACPECRAVDRETVILPWYLWDVTTCPIHGIVLRDRCRRCGALHAGVAHAPCTVCGRAAAPGTGDSLAADPYGAALAALIWGALTPDMVPVGVAPQWAADHPWNRPSVAAILPFLTSWSTLLLRRDPQHPFLQAPPGMTPLTVNKLYGPAIYHPTPVRHRLLTAAARLLLEWPTAAPLTFDRLAYGETQDQPATAFPLWFDRTFPGPAWDWIRLTWLTWMAEQITRNPRVQSWVPMYRLWAADHPALPQFLTVKEAASAAGVCYNTIQAYVVAGAIEATAEGPTRSPRYVASGSVESVQTQRAAYLTQSEAASWLGCDEKMVRQLVATGRLTPLTADPFTGQPSRRHWLTPETLTTFLTALLDPVPVAPLPEISEDAVLFLRQVLRRTRQTRMAPADLFTALEMGRLEVYRCDTEASVQSLWFPQAAVDRFLRWERWGDGQLYYTGPETCRILHCKPRTLARWSEARLLLARRIVEDAERVYRYDSRDLAAFRARYLPTRQAARLLGYAPNTLREWAVAGRVPVAHAPDDQGGHYRFDREALRAWRTGVMTVPEVAEAAAVSVDTIYRLVQDGQLQPIGGGIRHRWWFARPAVTAWAGRRLAWNAAAVAVFLGVSDATVYRWAQAGRLPVLAGVAGGWRFDEAAIRAWRAAHLTSQEAAQHCGVTRVTIYRWVKSGRLQALADMGAGQHWFARSALDQLLP